MDAEDVLKTIESLVADISAALEDEQNSGDILEGVAVRLENLQADLRREPRPHHLVARYLPEGYAEGNRPF